MAEASLCDPPPPTPPSDFYFLGFDQPRLNRKLLTAAGVSIRTEHVSSLAVTAIATVCVHAELGTWSPRETALVHIWSQYQALFECQAETLALSDAGQHR